MSVSETVSGKEFQRVTIVDGDTANQIATASISCASLRDGVHAVA
jgi:hypothetical protein